MKPAKGRAWIRLADGTLQEIDLRNVELRGFEIQDLRIDEAESLPCQLDGAEVRAPIEASNRGWFLAAWVNGTIEEAVCGWRRELLAEAAVIAVFGGYDGS